MGYTEKWIPSPHYSGRGGATVTQLTFHTTEGSQSGESLGNWLTDPSSQVSYHAAVDNNAPGIVFRYVDTDYKAWAQANYNPVAVSIAFCTPSGAASNWSRDTWLSKGWMLDNAAAIGRTFVDWYNLPLVELSDSQAQGGGRGICQHANLGSGGSGHHDCGKGRFPMDVMIQKMGGQASAPPSQPPSSGGGAAPPLHVDYFGRSHNSTCADVRTWQQKMKDRGWSIGVDQVYGSQSENICRQFQSEKGLTSDGLVGPATWNATWNSPVT